MKNLPFLFLCTLIACSGSQKPVTNDPEPVVSAKSSGIDLNAFDPSVRPQDDFYRHVNGTWLKQTKLPSDKSNYGSFTKVADDAEVHLRAIVDGLADTTPGTPEQKIADFYRAYIDASESPQADLEAIAPYLEKIDAIKTRKDFYETVAQFSADGIGGPFRIWMGSDVKDPNRYTVYLSQSGLTLRDRDYYLKPDDRFKNARELYVVYGDAIFAMAKLKPQSEALLKFETELATVSWTREERRDPDKQYNPKTIAELKKMSPKVPWDAYFVATGIPSRDQYIVSQPSFFEKMDDIVAKTKVSTLKNYLRFKTLSAFAGLLGKPGFDAYFAFFRKGLRGVKEPRPAWKRALTSMNWSMGELLGQVYVQHHFKPEAKTRMNTMVDTLTAAYAESIKDLEWMSEPTKTAALEKLSKFRPKIGYPDKWIDYSNLNIGKSAISNRVAVSNFEFQRDIGKLTKPVDKSEWGMPPQIVNAYYNAVWNEIVFPAAILQPPFFDLSADEAVNYGAIGSVIGHEIGHGFDDSGRKFDGDGVLRDWWTKEDVTKFDERKNGLAAQFNAFKAIEDLTVNGEFTSGENIGDLGGLAIAYRAYKMSLNGKEAPVIDGLTGDQRFFMGWAQVWRRLYTDDELKRRLVVDPHAPSEARTNVILKNIPAFYEAFGIKEGDGMYLPPEERIQIW